MTRVTLFVCAMLALGVAAADAGVTRIEIERREVFAGGHAFGAVGVYEKVVGRFHGELDPAQSLNRGIVDLDRAPRDGRGRIERSESYRVLVPRVDADGNEIGGIRLPDIAVPTATLTGWASGRRTPVPPARCARWTAP